ncbi:hypothetical protein [Absidia glauca]|uniref:HTH APSES-type domain-containing protein n=1 Tax=Absidia glauca TaxID=4829 RepID=A0A163J9H4_ABSGL|nr:hypothetical protein [Absidia glauca]
MEGLYHNSNNLYPSSSPYMIPHPDHSPYYSPTTSLPCRTGAPHSAFSDVRPPYSASSSQQHSDSLALSTSSSTANNTTPTPTGWSSSPTSPGYSWSGNYSQHPPPPPSYHHHPHHHASSSSSSSSLSSSTPSSRPHPYSSSTSCYALATHTPIQRPKLTTTVWEDEGTVCYQVDAKSVCVARRQDNDMINGTKLLNVVGMSRGKRDGILKNEKGRVVVKVGAMHLKGVWITFERAKDLAAKFKITDLLYPLFTDDPSVYLCPSTNGSMLPPPTMVPSTRPAMAFKPDPSFGFPPWDRSTDSFTNILRTNDQEPGSCSPDHDVYLMNPPPYDRPAFRNNNTTYDYDTFARKPMIKPPSHLYPHSPPHDEQQHSRKRSLPSSTPPPPDAQSRTTLKRLKTLDN